MNFRKIQDGRDILGKRLRRAMRENGITDQYLTGLLAMEGVRYERSTITRIKNGEIAATPRVVEAICAALRVGGDMRKEWHRAAAADYGYDMGEMA